MGGQVIDWGGGERLRGGGRDCAGGGGVKFKIKNRPSHHETVALKQFWWIAFSETGKT